MSTDAASSIDPSSLPTGAEQLQRMVCELSAREVQLAAALAESSQTIALQQDTIEKLSHELALMRRYVFGRRRERFVDDPRQQFLFAAQGGQPQENPAEEDEPPQTPRRKRRGHGRRPLPEFLPRKRIEHVLSPEELSCPCCGKTRKKIAEEVSEQLEYAPASLHVAEHVRFIYACCDCEEHGVTAPKPPQPIEKGLAGPSLLAHVITAKYAEHKPLYRQEDELARHGVFVRRSTLCDWMRGSAACLMPLYDLLVRWALASHVLGTDDTPVKVLDRSLEHTRTGRFWAYVGDNRHRCTVYDYTPNRSRDGPQAFLKDFQGVLQADAFGGYDGIYWESQGTIVEAGCCAHARRKFYDARETSPQPAHEGLAYFQRLYAIEDEAAELSDDDRLAVRQARSVPILQDLAVWLREQLVIVLPKSPVAGAIKYCLGHWDALTRFTTDAAIPIDNNRTERTLKDQALGRKNWIFLGSDNGGRTAAVLYSFVASAKRNHLDPQAYLTDVLTRLPQVKSALELRHLMPDRWAQAHPEHVRAYRQQESTAAAARRKRRRLRRRQRPLNQKA